MKTKLKRLRVEAGMTQAQVAEKVGVTQPNYQRWESDAAPIPGDKLKKLAKVFKTDEKIILGRHPPIDIGFYDRSAPENLQYYGEVSIHFRGGGKPLLISISEAACNKLHSDLQGNDKFITVESLSNQTVALRMDAIADVYFSSEAYDDYGPEHGDYEFLELRIPDPRDWEIIECLAGDEEGLEDFSEEDVERVRGMVMITNAEFEKLVAEGLIKPEDLASEKTKRQAETDEIFRMATRTRLQYTDGTRRDVYIERDQAMESAFDEIMNFGEFDLDQHPMIRIEAEGSHRMIFVNKRALDYVSVPTHLYEKGAVDSAAGFLDEDASAKPIEPLNPVES